jgi:hypothetical protein
MDVVPESRLVVLEDCGHCPQVEVPESVADLLAGLPAAARRDQQHLFGNSRKKGSS